MATNSPERRPRRWQRADSGVWQLAVIASFVTVLVLAWAAVNSHPPPTHIVTAEQVSVGSHTP
jgi:hypothetical protein